MDFKNSPYWIWWKEYGKHIEALAIIGLLILVWFAYHENNNLSEEIKNSCGWEREDYRCYCEKSDVIEIENKIKNELNPDGILDVKLGR